MQTYKTFLKIAKKRLPSCMIYFGIFVVLMFLMSFAANDSNNTQYKAYSLNISILDEDQSETSQALTDYLDSVHDLVPLEDEGETIQDSLFYHKVSYVLTIPKGFEDALLSGDTENLVESSKRKDSAAGFFVDEQIQQYLKTLRIYLASGNSVSEATEKTVAAMENCEDVTTVSFEEEGGESSTTMYYFFQYMPYILLILLILGLAPILITFRKKDLGNRINCSALRQSDKTLQLSLGCVSFCLIVWLLFILIAGIVYRQALFSKEGLLLMLNSFVFLLICMAIALLVSTFSPGNNALNMISNVVGLGMSFFCGIFVPQYMLGEQILVVARFLPAYWYIQITDRISGFSDEAFSMGLYWKCIGIQFLFFVAIFALYLVADKQRNQGRPKITSA
ncbi:MAG: ABC transporter permease [Lachnospiraceae bacterium]|nr:ABC transporter permease [Lachnospiraceae bacterium]